MLDLEIYQTKIAVRLYDNKRYGTTYGKGLYRKAAYNGTIDTKAYVKYLVDMYSYDDWVNMAKSDAQMEIVNHIQHGKDSLYSWVKRYDPISRDKVEVPGMCCLDLVSMELTVMICDESRDMTDTWRLKAKPCTARVDHKGPQLLATNCDLADW